MNHSRGWLVVMTKPKMESEAKEQLIHQGFEVYLPIWAELKRRQGEWQRIEAPMFPRYLFLRPRHEEQSLAPIRSTRGVSQLVRFGNDLAWAREATITEIRHLEGRESELSSRLTPFKKGDRVQVLGGPFKGVSAEVLACGQQRVIILMQVLGKMQQVEFEANLCQALN